MPGWDKWWLVTTLRWQVSSWVFTSPAWNLHVLIHHAACKFCYHSNTNQKRKLSPQLTCGTSQLCSSGMTGALNFPSWINDRHQFMQNNNELPTCKLLFFFSYRKSPGWNLWKVNSNPRLTYPPPLPFVSSSSAQHNRPWARGGSASALNRIYAF